MIVLVTEHIRSCSWILYERYTSQWISLTEWKTRSRSLNMASAWMGGWVSDPVLQTVGRLKRKSVSDVSSLKFSLQSVIFLFMLRSLGFEYIQTKMVYWISRARVKLSEIRKMREDQKATFETSDKRCFASLWNIQEIYYYIVVIRSRLSGREVLAVLTWQ